MFRETCRGFRWSHWNGTSGSGNACAGRDDVAIQELVVFFSSVRSATTNKAGTRCQDRHIRSEHELQYIGSTKVCPACPSVPHPRRSKSRVYLEGASAKERARFLGRREANRTSLAPSRPTWPTGRALYHMPTARVASRTSLVPPTSRSNNTNLEFKVRLQDKPGTTKEAQRHRCCLNKWPAGQAWYHRIARSNKTNHELKSGQQSKPGTTKKTTLLLISQHAMWPAGQAWHRQERNNIQAFDQ